MGLNVTHGCWDGPCSSFNEWRVAVAEAANMEFATPRNEYELWGLWISTPSQPLDVLLKHQDCEGVIRACDAGRLADALQGLLPKLSKIDLGWSMADVPTERFISGLRDAADEGRDVEFH